MPLRIGVPLALLAVSATGGAAASGGFVAKAPTGSSPQVQVTKHYDPLP